MKMIDRVKHPFRGTKEDAIIGVIEYSTFEQSDTRVPNQKNAEVVCCCGGLPKTNQRMKVIEMEINNH